MLQIIKPLTNLPDNQPEEVHPTGNYECSSSSNSMRKNTIKPGFGNKIPTIINVRVVNDEIKNPSWTTKHPARVPGKKINKYNHKVKIIGDSHLRGSAVNLNQYLNMKFEVASFIKPGTGINQLVHSQEMELLRLGKKDVIVINGGSNNINNNNANRKILILLTQFIQK
jgi:hypothetical protein